MEDQNGVAERWAESAREAKQAIQQHNTAVPPELVEYYAKKQGLAIQDPEVAKLIAISTEEFLSRVLTDAVDLTKKMQSDSGETKDDGPTEQGLTLHIDVLAKAMKDSGVNFSGNQYYPDISSEHQ